MSLPLAGRHLVVSRPEHQAEPLVSRLRAAGASVTFLPLIAIAPVADEAVARAVDGIHRYDAVAVTSANGADVFAARLTDAARAVPAGVFVVAVGEATAAALRRAGIHVDAVPDEATGAAIARALVDRGVVGARVLLPRAREGRPELPNGLRVAGALVDDVAFYDTVPCRPDLDTVADAAHADAVVLTSPSAVAVLAEAAGDHPAHRIISIGSTTSAAARAAGFTVIAEAAAQSVDGLVTAAVRALG